MCALTVLLTALNKAKQYYPRVTEMPRAVSLHLHASADGPAAGLPSISGCCGFTSLGYRCQRITLLRLQQGECPNTPDHRDAGPGGL